MLVAILKTIRAATPTNYGACAFGAGSPMVTVHRRVYVCSVKCVCVVGVAPQRSPHWGPGMYVLLSPLKPTRADAWLFSAHLPGPTPLFLIAMGTLPGLGNPAQS